MTNYFKILCGVISLGLSIWNFSRRTPIIGCYWAAVTFYWAFNFIGGII